MTMVFDGAISIGESDTRNGLNQYISNEWVCATDLETERNRLDDSLAVDYEKLCALAFDTIRELKQEVVELKNK